MTIRSIVPPLCSVIYELDEDPIICGRPALFFCDECGKDLCTAHALGHEEECGRS